MWRVRQFAVAIAVCDNMLHIYISHIQSYICAFCDYTIGSFVYCHFHQKATSCEFTNVDKVIRDQLVGC